MENSSSNLDRAIFLVIFLSFFLTAEAGGEPGARGGSGWCFDEGVVRSNVG